MRKFLNFSCIHAYSDAYIDTSIMQRQLYVKGSSRCRGMCICHVDHTWPGGGGVNVVQCDSGDRIFLRCPPFIAHSAHFNKGLQVWAPRWCLGRLEHKENFRETLLLAFLLILLPESTRSTMWNASVKEGNNASKAAILVLYLDPLYMVLRIDSFYAKGGGKIVGALWKDGYMPIL